MNEAPKSSSFGIRLDAPTLARLDGYAEQIGHKRGGAAARVIAAGLDALEGLPVAVRAAPPVRDAKGYASILARLDALEAVKLKRGAAELRREAAELRRYELDGYELAAIKRRFWQGGDGFDELKDEEVELSASAAELRAEWTELRGVAAELKRADLEELLQELLQAEELEGTVLEAVERRSTTRLTEADVGRWVAGRGGRSKAHKLARLGGGGVGEYACGLSFALGSAALAADSHTRCAGCAK